MALDFHLDDAVAVRAGLKALTRQQQLPKDSLLVVLADSSGYATMTVEVGDIPTGLSRMDRVRTLAPLVRRLRDDLDACGVMLVIVRQDAQARCENELAWCDVFVGAAQTAHLVCHGVYVVTDSDVARYVSNHALRRISRIAPRRVDASSR